MPRLPKPKALRQNTEHRDVGLVALDGGLLAVPDPRPRWLADTKVAWEGFWTSPLAQTVLPATDGPAIRRLFDLRDEHERLSAAVRKSALVAGSMGQPRAHPLYARLGSLEGSITTLEDRIGLTASARLKLGISLGEAQKSLASLNEDIDDTDGAAAADLLLTFADTPAVIDGITGRPLDGVEPRPRAGRRTG